MSKKIVQRNGEAIKGQIKELVRGTAGEQSAPGSHQRTEQGRAAFVPAGAYRMASLWTSWIWCLLA